MAIKSLIINPGSTSTKIAVFEGKEKLFDTTLRYSTEELASFGWVMEQVDFRRATIEKALADNNIDPDSLDAICARGGQVPYCAAGTYRVDQAMVDFMYTRRHGAHASNLGCVLALLLAKPLGIPAYIVDPVMVDEMDDAARISGMPMCPRKPVFHALNQKATARLHCERMGWVYEESNLIVAHMGGGISVAAHKQGRIVDVNNALDGDGPFAPDRAGSIPSSELIKVCFSGQYTKEELLKFISSKGGLVAYLGTNSVIQVMERIAQGDQRAKKVLDAMCYNIVKQIGAMAAALSGSVQAIVLTGGIAYNEPVVEYIRERCSFIAPIAVYPGENELEALVTNALVVLRGVITPKVYK